MPYARRRYRRKPRRRTRRKKKKYSVSIAKLKSKRVDTLLEKRIVDLSKKTLVSSKSTYVARGIWTRDGTWPALDVWPDVANSLTSIATQFRYAQFGRVGGYLNNDLSVEMSLGNDPANPTEQPARPYNFRDMFLRLKALIFEFRFLNTGQEAQEVDICLWRCPMRKRLIALDGAAPQAQAANQPQMYWHKPFTSLNTITPQCQRKFRDQAANIVPDRHTLLAHKRFKIEPGRIIDAPGGGAASANLIKWKRVRVAKYFKGLGKREKYELVLNTISPDAAGLRGQLADCRYYYSMRTTGTIVYHAASAVTFQRGKNTDRQVVFDDVAHLAT